MSGASRSARPRSAPGRAASPRSSTVPVISGNPRNIVLGGPHTGPAGHRQARRRAAAVRIPRHESVATQCMAGRLPRPRDCRTAEQTAHPGGAVTRYVSVGRRNARSWRATGTGEAEIPGDMSGLWVSASLCRCADKRLLSRRGRDTCRRVRASCRDGPTKRVYLPISPALETRIYPTTPERRARSNRRNSTGATPCLFDSRDSCYETRSDNRDPCTLTVICAPAGSCCTLSSLSLISEGRSRCPRSARRETAA